MEFHAAGFNIRIVILIYLEFRFVFPPNQTFPETNTVRHTRILPVIGDGFVPVLAVQRDGVGLFYTRFEAASACVQFDCPPLQFRQNLGGNTFSPLAGEYKHPFHFHDLRIQRLNGAATDCQLISGPTQDFNLMVRNSSLPARVQRVSGDFHTAVGAMKTIAVYAINTRARVQFNAENLLVPPATLAWRTLRESATVEVHAPHALWMEVSSV